MYFLVAIFTLIGWVFADLESQPSRSRRLHEISYPMNDDPDLTNTPMTTTTSDWMKAKIAGPPHQTRRFRRRRTTPSPSPTSEILTTTTPSLTAYTSESTTERHTMLLDTTTTIGLEKITTSHDLGMTYPEDTSTLEPTFLYTYEDELTEMVCHDTNGPCPCPEVLIRLRHQPKKLKLAVINYEGGEMPNDLV